MRDVASDRRGESEGRQRTARTLNYRLDAGYLLSCLTDYAAERNRTARKDAVLRFSHTFRTQNGNRQLSAARNCLISLKAAIGIEPMNKGFADLCLTTWLRRREEDET